MYRPFVGLTACVLSGVNTLKFGSYFPFLHFQYFRTRKSSASRLRLARVVYPRSVTDLSTGTDPHRHTPGTHNHTQTPAEQGRRGQARQTHEVFRTRPTRRASKRARPTTNQSSSQPAPHRPRGPRAGRIPTPRVRSSRPQGALNPRSSARPRKWGRPPGARATPTHAAHSPTHTHTHSSTHSHPVEERWKGAPCM